MSYWHDLWTNLASEFISPPGHTGIMDTALCVMTVGPALRAGRLAGLAAAKSRSLGIPARRLPFPTRRARCTVAPPRISMAGSSSARAKWEQNATFFDVHFTSCPYPATCKSHVIKWSHFRLLSDVLWPCPWAHKGCRLRLLTASLPHLYRFAAPRWRRHSLLPRGEGQDEGQTSMFTAPLPHLYLIFTDIRRFRRSAGTQKHHTLYHDFQIFGGGLNAPTSSHS